MKTAIALICLYLLPSGPARAGEQVVDTLEYNYAYNHHSDEWRLVHHTDPNHQNSVRSLDVTTRFGTATTRYANLLSPYSHDEETCEGRGYFSKLGGGDSGNSFMITERVRIGSGDYRELCDRDRIRTLTFHRLKFDFFPLQLKASHYDLKTGATTVESLYDFTSRKITMGRVTVPMKEGCGFDLASLNATIDYRSARYLSKNRACAVGQTYPMNAAQSAILFQMLGFAEGGGLTGRIVCTTSMAPDTEGGVSYGSLEHCRHEKVNSYYPERSNLKTEAVKALAELHQKAQLPLRWELLPEEDKKEENEEEKGDPQKSTTTIPLIACSSEKECWVEL